MIDRTLMRPRNLIKIFNHCRGFAATLNRNKIEESDIEKGMKAYSNDLLEELDRELTDVFPRAKELIYYFLDAKAVLSTTELNEIYKIANIDEADFVKVTDFLLYYGVLGIHTPDNDHFIYSVGYDLKVLKIRAARGGGNNRYIINPAFWPALSISAPITHLSEKPGAP